MELGIKPNQFGDRVGIHKYFTLLQIYDKRLKRELVLDMLGLRNLRDICLGMSSKVAGYIWGYVAQKR